MHTENIDLAAARARYEASKALVFRSLALYKDRLALEVNLNKLRSDLEKKKAEGHITNASEATSILMKLNAILERHIELEDIGKELVNEAQVLQQQQQEEPVESINEKLKPYL